MEKKVKLAEKHEAEPDDDTKPKSRGKGSIIPSDPGEILKRDGFYDEKDKFAAVVASLHVAPFTFAVRDPTQQNEFIKDAKKAVAKVANITKAIVKIQTMNARRLKTPDEAPPPCPLAWGCQWGIRDSKCDARGHARVVF